MEVSPTAYTSLADLTVDTVQAWTLGLTDMEGRLGARYPR